MSQFFRNPIAGGDNSVWASYLLAQIKNSVGEYTSYLYDNAGTVTLSPGRVGINDGTNEGVSIIDTVTAITLTGANSLWYKIEMTVSGTAVTLSATALADNDPALLPATLTASYVTAKQGFYHIATRRLLGIAWKDATGVLGGIINCQNMVNGYRGYVYLDSPTNEAKMYYDWCQDCYRRWVEYTPSTKWNMNANNLYTASHYLGSEIFKIKSVSTQIINNAVTVIYDIGSYDDQADPDLLKAGYTAANTATGKFLWARRTGGGYAAASFDAAVLKANVELTM